MFLCFLKYLQDLKGNDVMTGYRLKFMQAGKAVIEPFEVREPADDEIVIKISYTLISNGTEKSLLRGDEHTGKKFPRIPGYSGVGKVVKCGKSVKEFKTGDRVFVAKGGHASYNIKKTIMCEKIPDNVSFQDAVFTRMISFPLFALRRAEIEMGESVVVVGLGQLGLFAIQLAKIAGGLPVIGVGNREIRRTKALEFGANYVFDPNDPDLKEEVITKCRITNKAADIVIETSGNIDGLISAMSYTSTRGRIVISGCYWQENAKPIDLLKVNSLGYKIIGAQDRCRMPYNSAKGNWTMKKDFKAILGFMSDGRLTPSLIQPEYSSPFDAPNVYERLIYDKEFPLGLIFDWTNLV